MNDRMHIKSKTLCNETVHTNIIIPTEPLATDDFTHSKSRVLPPSAAGDCGVTGVMGHTSLEAISDSIWLKRNSKARHADRSVSNSHSIDAILSSCEELHLCLDDRGCEGIYEVVYYEYVVLRTGKHSTQLAKPFLRTLACQALVRTCHLVPIAPCLQSRYELCHPLLYVVLHVSELDKCL